MMKMHTLNATLAEFFQRDIRKLIHELEQFRHEENIWKTAGVVRNSCGNLALHIIGGNRYLIGNLLGRITYIRDRDQEFAARDVRREHLVADLENLIPLITQSINTIDVDDNYPIPFDDGIRTNGYVLIQLSVHLNYHLGQVNYLRRILEPAPVAF